MDIAVGSKGQRQKLRPPGRHVLVERGEQGGGSRVLAHQRHDVDQRTLTEEGDRLAVGVRVKVMAAEDLTTELNDDRLACAQSRERSPMPPYRLFRNAH